MSWEFLGGLVVRIPDFHCRGPAARVQSLVGELRFHKPHDTGQKKKKKERKKKMSLDSFLKT